MDGKYILSSLGLHLETLSIVTNFVGTVNGHTSIFVAKTNPVGDVYPQITMDLDISGSNPSFSSTNAFVNITLWYEAPQDSVSQVLSKMKPVMDAIRDSLDYRGKPSTFCPLNDISVEENKGLRVVRFLKFSQKDLDWDDQMKKHFSSLDYDVVMGENEDFTIDYGDLSDGDINRI